MTVRGTVGLRELKKKMTRESIAEAALQLTVEKGLDNVTIEEVAHVAFISPRTVSNYFSCKEEAVAAAGADDSLAIIEDLARRPLSEPPLQSLCELWTDFARTRTGEQLHLAILQMELGEQHPALHPYQAALYDRLEEGLREAIAARTGTDPTTDTYPSLVAAAAVSAVRAAMRVWASTGAPPGKLPELIQTAFLQIGDGLRAPQPHRWAG